MRQIEKKYLVKTDIQTLIDDLQLEKQDVSEFYTDIRVCKEVRYSRVGSNYYKTIKTGVTGSKELNSIEVTKANYLKKRKKLVGHKIFKNRYTIEQDREKYFIDRYLDNLDGLYMLEVLFKNKKDRLNYELPDIFRHFVIKDITKDERYQNKNLALLGNPEKNPYNIYVIFKDIELGRIKDLNNTIFKEMKTSDAIRIVLYKLFINLKSNLHLMLQTDANEGLKEFRSTLKTSRVILDEYKKIFDKKIIQKVRVHLKLIDSAIKTEKNLNFIKNELNNLDKLIDPAEMKELKNSINQKQRQERHNICKFFTTREFSIIFKQYELLLKENNRSFLSVEAQTSIENNLKYVVSMHDKEAIMLYSKYEGCEDDKSYKIIKKPFKILKALLQEFSMVIDPTQKHIMLDNTNSVLKKLTEFENIKKKQLIAETYLSNLKIKPSKYLKIIKSIKKEAKNAIFKKEKKFHNSIENFKNQKHTFKE